MILFSYYVVSRILFLIYYKLSRHQRRTGAGAKINATLFLFVPPLGEFYFIYRMYDAWKFEYRERR